jgi:hypothetical protein
LRAGFFSFRSDASVTSTLIPRAIAAHPERQPVTHPDTLSLTKPFGDDAELRAWTDRLLAERDAFTARVRRSDRV